MKNRFIYMWMTIQKEKGLMVLCFLLAFFVWQGIRKTIGFEVPVANIGVEIDVPEGWAVLEKSVNEVDVLFSGSREDVRYLNNEQLRMIIPVANPTYGEEVRIQLSNRFLRNPTSARVVEFNPSEIILKLDQESERMLPIKASLEGHLPDGLQIDRIVCTPASISVSGARQILESLDSMHTTPIDLKGRQSAFKETVHVSLPKSGRLQANPDRVSVEISFLEQSSTRVIQDVPVFIAAPAVPIHHTIDIMPKTVDITIKGHQQIIENLRITDLFAYVNCADLEQPANYEIPVSIDLPSNVKLISVDPAIINLSFKN